MADFNATKESFTIADMKASETHIKNLERKAEVVVKMLGGSHGAAQSASLLGLDPKTTGFLAAAMGGGGPLKGAVTGGAAAGLAGGGAGVVGGAIGGGMMGVLKMIADAVMDFPMVVAVMKMFKLIMTILLLPLIPILKPVLILLGLMARLLIKIMMPIVKAMDKVSNTVTKQVKDASGAATQGVQGLGIKVGDTTFGINFKDIGQWLSDAGKVLVGVLDWISKAVTDTVNGILSFLGTVPSLLLKAWNWFLNIGPLLWTTVLLPAWNWFKNIGNLIWTTILLPAWNVLKDVGTWIWDILKTPFQAVADAISDAVNAIKNLGGSVIKSITNLPIVKQIAKAFGVGDAIISGGKVITTHPDDYIIATKNPNMGGNVSITINNPTVSQKSDITDLVREIEKRIGKDMRRRVSYV